jgi:hypothetical protein
VDAACFGRTTREGVTHHRTTHDWLYRLGSGSTQLPPARVFTGGELSGLLILPSASATVANIPRFYSYRLDNDGSGSVIDTIELYERNMIDE